MTCTERQGTLFMRVSLCDATLSNNVKSNLSACRPSVRPFRPIISIVRWRCRQYIRLAALVHASVCTVYPGDSVYLHHRGSAKRCNAMMLVCAATLLDRAFSYTWCDS